MAIFHMSFSNISAGKGRSAIASAAYRSGKKLFDQKEGRSYFYARSVMPESFILTPKNAPEWASDREQLWNEVEKKDRKSNSRYAKEFNVALPVELSEIQQVSNKVIELSDGLTKQLGLQEARKEPEHDLKKLSAHDLNKSYQGLQQQVQQTTNSQQKAQFKNQLHEIHEEISNRTQKQLQAFAEQNPEIKQPESKLDQSLKR